jgi:hypothetical protein
MSKSGSQTLASLDDNTDGDIKQPDEAVESSDEPSLSSTALALILLGLSLPVFLIALDTSIVATVGIPFASQSNGRNWLTSLCFVPRPSPISQIDSNLRRILGGMGAHIFLHCLFLQTHCIVYCTGANIGQPRCSLQPLSGKLYATFSLKVSKAHTVAIMQED